MIAASGPISKAALAGAILLLAAAAVFVAWMADLF
jgi:hypothetical protein